MAITIATLRAAGLSPDQTLAVLEAEKAQGPSPGAIRQRRYREKKRDVTVTSPTVTSHGQLQLYQELMNGGKGVTVTSPVTPASSLTLLSSSVDSFPEPRARGAHPLPDDWQPNEGHVDLAKSLKWDRERFWFEAGKMRDWALSNGKRKHDWDRTFSNWIRRVGRH